MPFITTSKLRSSSAGIKTAFGNGGILGMADAVERHPVAKDLFEATTTGKDYRAFREGTFQYTLGEFKTRKKSGTQYREGDTMVPTAPFGVYVNNTTFYLVGKFKSLLYEGRTFHFRFENTGEGELTDFHLTCDHNLGKQKRMDGTSDLWMNCHLYFKVDGGKLVFHDKNKIRGSGDDQVSDYRMGDYLYDACVYMYYFMYLL